MDFCPKVSECHWYCFQRSDEHVCFPRTMPKKMLLSRGMQTCLGCKWINLIQVFYSALPFFLFLFFLYLTFICQSDNNCKMHDFLNNLLRLRRYFLYDLLILSLSYCSCDRNHGGFDCSIEIVSHKGIFSFKRLFFIKFFFLVVPNLAM